MRANHQILITILILIITIIPANGIEQGKIQKDDILSMADCVALAINNSPVIKKYEYNLQIASSNLGIAKSAYFPTLGAGMGVYQEYNSNKNYDNGSAFRELPSAGVYLKQLIWDFGRTNSAIRMERFYKLAAEYEFMDSICNTIFNVKSKYFAVLKTKAITEIESNNVLINEKNVQRCKQLYESGQKSKIDYIDSLVFLNEAKMSLTDAENNYKLALADLGNALYTAYAPDFSIKNIDTFNFDDTYIPDYIKETIPANNQNENSHIHNVAFKTGVEKNDNCVIKKLPFQQTEAYDLAYQNSPDLWVLETTVNAMKQALIYVKRAYFPEISGNIGFNYTNRKEFSNHDLNMYINVTSAVNIKQLKHEIDRATANVNLASNDVELFKQNLYFEVKKCFFNVDKNVKQLSAAQTRVKNALEDFNIANKQYENGETNYIALQQARKVYNDSKIQYVNTLYDYNTSLADLEIAMHYHFDDLHAQAEHALHYHYKDIIDKLEASMHCEHRHEEENNMPIKEKL